MRLFGRLYDKVMTWSRHRYAPWYLVIVSFMESSFFPIPVALMLAPMVAANPKRGIWLASLTTVSSVLGGLLGYLIGFFLLEAVYPYIVAWGYLEAYELAKQWFEQWGAAALFVAGFSPIPYKIFTIAAGGLAMPLLPFILVSLIGRAGQFFLIAVLIMLLGPKFEPLARRYVEWLGWFCVAAVVIGYIVLRL